jgi:hypothetical protein
MASIADLKIELSADTVFGTMLPKTWMFSSQQTKNKLVGTLIFKPASAKFAESLTLSRIAISNLATTAADFTFSITQTIS